MIETPKLSKVVESRYGVGILTAPPVALIWGATFMIERLGVKPAEARTQLSEANRRREKAGRVPAYPEYGTVLFGN